VCEDILGGAIKTTLDVGIDLLVLEAGGTKVDSFDGGFLGMFEEDVLGLEVAMHHAMVSEQR
jgi:hypothetical protein